MTLDASRRFAHELVDHLFDHVEQVEQGPVVEWTDPKDLRELVRITAGTMQPLELAKLVTRYSNHLHHPQAHVDAMLEALREESGAL